MSDLLDVAVKAHGGLDAWNRHASVSIDLSIGGGLWDLKGQTGLFAASTFDSDLRAQRATFGHFGDAKRRMRFSPEKLSLETTEGSILAVRDNPRAAFAGHVNETPWDGFHAAYFCAYALWTYVTLPFLYTYPGFATEEIAPWQEDGETWRRLKVTFPANIASHTREQVSYFGPDGILRRHDYAVDVLGGSQGAHYVHDYHDHDGILVPHRRRVYPLGPDNNKIAEPILVSIDIKRLHWEPAG
ncbi:hypothetical protein [Methylovirgula sp. 4M-Z18]|uniref:hypothetical protein n=1 Tax=Methylovirgula sp. 4M-Z18 TaxID=2293567 RepID=UPI000E2ECB05|nr:hypothetical protein [Methylovirgula sp. 4M-Z18]RFB75710.1 hypothetical protein DYH55_21720 [Methylovirgula sp. 4M-Z18]